MRLLLIERNTSLLTNLAAKFYQLSDAAFEAVALDLHLALETELPGRAQGMDMVILGEGLERVAEALAQEILDLSVSIKIVLCNAKNSTHSTHLNTLNDPRVSYLRYAFTTEELEVVLQQSQTPNPVRKVDDLINKKIAGRYRVLKVLGAGSFGITYLCEHQELAQTLVVIKILYPDLSKNVEAQKQFQSEIMKSYRVSHPNVIRCYEYFRDGDIIGCSMEYASGGDLAQKLSNSTSPLPISDCIKLLKGMAVGLQAIHDAGILHHNLNLENILLTANGEVKIADFCIARTIGDAGLEKGGVIATIDHISPEYMLKSVWDNRSDLYSLGMVAYELITKRLPFRGNTVYETMTRRLKAEPEPLRKYRVDCPAQLETLVLKLIARDPDQRFQSAQELYNALNVLILKI